MTRTQGWLVVLACALLALWLARAPVPAAVRARVALPPAPAAAVLPDLDSVRERVAQLHQRLSVPLPLAASRRNPFEFRGVSSLARAAAIAASPAPAAPGPPPRPEMTLVGMAEDGEPDTGSATSGAGQRTPGGASRTALVAAQGQLHFLKEGDRLLGRFLTVRVLREAVELKDEAGGSVILTLK